jgi:peptide/nickel transport system permease protein
VALAISRRVGASVVALCALIVFVFVMARMTGNPAALYLGEGASQQQIHEYEVVHGLNKPVWNQFFSYVRDVVHGDFGQSTLYNAPAMHVALSRFPNTLVLALVTFVLGLLIGSVLGSVAAYWEGRAADKVITAISTAALSFPSFWLALVLVLVFALKLGWLPSSGMSGLSSYVLPIVTLLVANLGVVVQAVRDSLVGVLRSEYVAAATAKGMRRWYVVTRHAWRNASIPVLTIAGATAVGIVNGALIVETVFDWPGIGQVVVNAVLNRDFALLQAAVTVIGIAVVVFNVLIELSYVFLDPRIRR